MRIIALLFGFTALLSSINVIGQSDDGSKLKHKLALAKEDTARVNALSELARFYIFSIPDTVATYATQGLQLARQIGYKSGEGNCLSSLCLSLTFLGNYTDALNYGLKAISIFKDLQDTTMIIWTEIQVMTCYLQLEDYDQALLHGNQAKRLFTRARAMLTTMDSNQLSVGLGVLGTVYEKKNELDSAFYYNQQAFNWNRSWNGIYQNIGEVYLKMGRVDSALHYFRNGTQVALKEGSSVGLVNQYNSLSKVFESNGAFDSAIYYANGSIQQASEQAIPLGLLQAATLLSNLYEKQGKPDSTIKYLKLANTLKDSLYSRKKTREAKSFAFNEKLYQQELSAQRQQDKNKIR